MPPQDQLQDILGQLLLVVNDSEFELTEMAAIETMKDIMPQISFASTKAMNGIHALRGLLDAVQPVVSAVAGVHLITSCVWGGIQVVVKFLDGSFEVLHEMEAILEMLSIRLPLIVGLSDRQRSLPEDKNLALIKSLHAVCKFILHTITYMRKPTEGSKATTLFKEFASHVKKTFKAPKLVAYFRSANQEMDKLFGWALDEFHWKAEKLRRKEEYARLFRDCCTRLGGVNFSAQLHSKLECIRRFPNAGCAWAKSNNKTSAWLKSHLSHAEPDTEASPDPSRLWIHGKAGTGKSILAAYLIKHVLGETESGSLDERYSSSDELVLYHFCGMDDQDPGRFSEKYQLHNSITKTTASSILRTFLLQLFSGVYKLDEDARTWIADDITSHRSNWHSVDQLMEHFLCLSKPYKKWCIVLDGLDQCDREIFDDESGLIPWITREAPESFRILVTSRKEDYITQRLSGRWSEVRLGDPDTTQQSLCQYAKDYIAKVNQKNMDTHDYPLLSNDLVEGLTRAADNMFLYLRLLFEELLEADYLLKDHTLEKLKETPPGLNGVYAAYFITHLSRLSDHQVDVLIHTLQLILYARQPVTWNLLYAVLSIRVKGWHSNATVNSKRRDVTVALGTLFEVQKNLTDEEHLVPLHSTLHSHLAEYDVAQISYDVKGLSEGTLHSKVAKEKAPYLYESLRDISSHRSLVTTCSAVLLNTKTLDAIATYHQYTDARRRTLDDTSKWAFLDLSYKWATCPPVDLELGQRPAHLWRLQYQLVGEESWTGWLRRQSNSLENDRHWRRQAENANNDALKDRDLYPNIVAELERRQEAYLEMDKHLNTASEAISYLRNSEGHELWEYSLHHVFSHYHQLHLDGESQVAADLIIHLLSNSLDNLDSYTSCLAQQVIDDNVDVAAVIANSAIVLGSLRTVSDLIRQFTRALAPRGSVATKILLLTRSASLDFCSRAISTDAAEMWELGILKDLELFNSSIMIKPVFQLVTCVLAVLRDAEITLFKEPTLAIGQGNLINAIRQTSRILSHWMIFELQGRRTNEVSTRPLDMEYRLLHRRVLHGVELAKQRYKYNAGTVVIDFGVWRRRLILTLALCVSCVVLGIITRNHIVITVLFTLLFSETAKDRTLSDSNPACHRRMTRSLPPFMIAGLLISRACNSPLSVLFTIVVSGSLYTTGRVQVTNDEGVIRLVTHMGSRRIARAIVGTSVLSVHAGFWGASAGVLALLLPWTRVVGLLAATVAIYKIILKIADPDDLQSFLVQLRELHDKSPTRATVNVHKTKKSISRLLPPPTSQ